ncbi:MAG: methyltransferase domain-containing protein [Gammaproteobacteria bacterium]|nr:methyltransferase domain-containing protein [Gammaproteobacteria bacterium]
MIGGAQKRIGGLSQSAVFSDSSSYQSFCLISAFLGIIGHSLNGVYFIYILGETHLETGSYSFDGFTESHKELERLKQQAQQIEPFETSLLQAAGLKPGMKALDVGCGPGVVSCLMARMVGDDGDVLGVDASDDLMGVAEQMGQAAGVNNLSFQKADIYQLDLPENSFDFAYSRLVFQHLTDPQSALKKLLGVLKPGGILCVADIDDDWLSIEPEPAAFRTLIDRSTRVQAGQGGDRFIGHKLGAYMESAGFNDVDVHVMPITSKMMGMKNFLDIGLGFRAFATSNDEEHEVAKRELQTLSELSHRPGSWGFLAIFASMGKK